MICFSYVNLNEHQDLSLFYWTLIVLWFFYLNF